MKTGIVTIAAALLMMLMMPITAISAEVYWYTDEYGVIRYTENLADVPEDQRGSARLDGRRVEAPAPESSTPAPAEAAADTDPDGTITADALNQMLESLSAEYDRLAAEREQLEQEGRGLDPAVDHPEYRKRVDDFNRRMAAYESRRQAFQEKSEALRKQPTRRSRDSGVVQTAVVPSGVAQRRIWSEAELHREYEELAALRKSLADDSGRQLDEKQQEKHRKEIAQYNRRVAAYEKNRAAFEETRAKDALNQRMRDRRQALETADQQKAATAAAAEHQATIEALNRREAELNRQYQQLMAERDTLVKAGEGLTGEAEIIEQREKIADLNQRIAAYRQAREAHVKQVDAYNRSE